MNRRQLASRAQRGRPDPQVILDLRESQGPQVIPGLRESQDLLVQMVRQDPQDRQDQQARRGRPVQMRATRSLPRPKRLLRAKP